MWCLSFQIVMTLACLYENIKILQTKRSGRITHETNILQSSMDKDVSNYGLEQRANYGKLKKVPI